MTINPAMAIVVAISIAMQWPALAQDAPTSPPAVREVQFEMTRAQSGPLPPDIPALKFAWSVVIRPDEPLPTSWIDFRSGPNIALGDDGLAVLWTYGRPYVEGAPTVTSVKIAPNLPLAGEALRSDLQHAPESPPGIEGYELRQGVQYGFAPQSGRYIGVWIATEPGKERIIATYPGDSKHGRAQVVARTSQPIAAVSVTPGIHGPASLIVLTQPQADSAFTVSSYLWDEPSDERPTH